MKKRRVPVTIPPLIPHAHYVGGTLVLENIGEKELIPKPWQWINQKWRCPAVHYREVLSWLQKNGIENRIPSWTNVAWTLHDGRSPHDYQVRP